MRIHVICHGNGLRSIIGEAYIKSLQRPGVEVLSSGTDAQFYMQAGMPVSVHALATLRQHGIEAFAKQHRTQLTPNMVQPEDTVVCVSPSVYEEAKQLVQLPEHTYVWHVEDIGEAPHIPGPGVKIEDLFEDIFQEVKTAADKLLAEK